MSLGGELRPRGGSFAQSQDSVGSSGTGHGSSEETRLGERRLPAEQSGATRGRRGVAERFSAVTGANVSS